MKINHLDLQVTDVPRAAAFYERFFGLEIRSNRASPALVVLSDGAGFVLVLQRRKGGGEAYPEGFHFGFLLDDVAEVRAFHARAVAGGLDVSDVIENGRGTLVYVRDPDGITVEVSCRERAPKQAPGA